MRSPETDTKRTTTKASRKKASAAALAAAALIAAALLPEAASAASGHRAARADYNQTELRRDLAAVRRAGGGDVNVLARVDGLPGGRLQARLGTVSVGSHAPVPWGSHFWTASTTKAFVATVVLQLAAEKQLSLDDTVEHWLPGVVSGHGNDGSRITVRDLLRQTSGLYDYVDDPDLQQKLREHFDENRYNDTSPADLVMTAVAHKPLFVPEAGRTRWAYSNTNYLLAGMIAEKASGTGWRELVEHRIIARLGLSQTSVPGLDPFLPTPYVSTYLTGTDGTRLDVTTNSYLHTADSGVVSTTADLNTFFRALADGRLLPAEQWRQMRQTVQRTDDPDDVAELPEGTYGLGLREIPLSCGGHYYMHEGDGYGTYTRPAVSSDGRSAVTISVTTTSAMPDLSTLNRATGTLIDHALCAVGQ
ncbi:MULTISPECIES: serine hydrolase [unclassified Streptomyces]|uniref:serine hydrolase domain-containing protein n=1 Tax=unclassified Streptomyces TaxID=2593676 RepID=UPI00225C21E9|nr:MULTISPECIES: serine hydrolase domain-containing protein [unclassified Streptomyces]MCX4403593.1 beta-lactamase family protein [Streptomyces sp. NBC_01764]MCX5181450.1 beta-lactamase family protein [Streptomyces sp. NBC_00268]